ncbi:hypothetical protein RFI_12818 [Reticulomyxa filosa]|uniref:Uncharacterized protein n=1 Tax=Reticulomyxa filosa TaxID=46433 RepID=X6NF06_RETFI|nr:hypothetical protein RFI_12818 [Reticulomyxa filosa]|eukprot:ETO24339.1 hypothetical protein RFI_12818 [Reticulomyxa filosa]
MMKEHLAALEKKKPSLRLKSEDQHASKSIETKPAITNTVAPLSSTSSKPSYTCTPLTPKTTCNRLPLRYCEDKDVEMKDLKPNNGNCDNNKNKNNDNNNNNDNHNPNNNRSNNNDNNSHSYYNHNKMKGNNNRIGNPKEKDAVNKIGDNNNNDDKEKEKDYNTHHHDSNFSCNGNKKDNVNVSPTRRFDNDNHTGNNNYPQSDRILNNNNYNRLITSNYPDIPYSFYSNSCEQKKVTAIKRKQPDTLPDINSQNQNGKPLQKRPKPNEGAPGGKIWNWFPKQPIQPK